MNEAIDFFRKLLDTADWPPRWHCGKWTEFHGWLYIISDLLIWSAYFAIPLIILKFISRRAKARFIRAYFLFAGFILACGSTHLLDAITFWYPAYRLNALVRLITGIVSWATVFYMIRIMPYAMRLKSAEELEHEIKERKKIEQELRLSNQQLNQAQDIANMGYWQWDVMADKVQWSEKLFEIFGVEPGTQVSYGQFLNLIHPRDRQRVDNIIRTAMSTRQFTPFYHQVLAADGSEKILLEKGEVLTGPDGSVTGMVGTAQDVTEQQKAQIALMEKTQALETSNTELQRFAYVASHDLQEPLRKILTFASMLQTEQGKPFDERSAMYVGKIVQSAGRMQRLIEDILQFSSLKDNHQEFEHISLHSVLQQVLSDMEVKIEQSKANIEWDELPEVEANRSQMGQLFQNLLGNAIKFTRPGREPHIRITSAVVSGSQVRQMPELKAYTENFAIPENRWDESAFALVRIADKGIGFKPAFKEKVFEIFQRLHPGHEYGGTGIGLAICKRIMENHNGTITVESTEGEGSVFTFLLPVRHGQLARLF